MNRNQKNTMKSKLPGISRWLLNRLPSSYCRFPLLGDLEEEFHLRSRIDSPARARRWYRRQALKSLPALQKNLMYWSGTMFRSYLITALRNIKRRKGFALMNILGLAVGMTCFMLMMLYVRHEFGFDRIFPRHEQIYRVIRHYPGTGDRPEALVAGAPAPLAPTMEVEFPEVISATRIGEVQGIFRIDEQTYSESGMFADQNFLKIFGLKLKKGNSREVLTNPFSVILTESLAEKLFGPLDPVGKIVNFSKQKNILRYASQNENYDMKITGVVADVPENSHIQFEYLISFPTIAALPGGSEVVTQWRNSAYYNYVLLREGTNYITLHDRLAEYSPRFRGNDQGKYVLQPLGDIHWRPDVLDNLPGNVTSSKTVLFLYTSIAFFILILACINYMNLATAGFSQRTKEVGLRKVVGARKPQLVRQFMGESLLLAAFSALLAGLSAVVVLPLFNTLVDRNLHLNFLETPVIPAVMLGLVLFAGLFAGAYPAFFLSAFHPISTLRGTIGGRPARKGIRNILIVVQFTISICLIVGTAVIWKQMRYIKTKDVGYEREHVLVIPLRDDEARSKGDLIAGEMRSFAGIDSVTNSEYVPLEKNNVDVITYIGEDEKKLNLSAYTCEVGYDFFDVFKLNLVSGRPFSREYPTDEKESVILNQTAVRMAGWNDPIGRVINVRGGRVVGVVKDFHQSSLHDSIDPMIFRLVPNNYNFLSARLNPGNISGSLKFMREVIEKYSARFPFEYYFQDDYFNRKYRADERFGKAFGVTSFLTIFIACLGMFGLAAFSAERRTREIAIRKIMGAPALKIVGLLSREFILLVLIANAAAAPIVYYLMNRWLRNFAYRISMDIWSFITGAILSLAVAGLIVGWKSLSAASANPADNLRVE